MKTFTARMRSDKRKNPELRTYRYMTATEAKNLHYGDHVSMLDQYGHVATVKINGAPKTWKTRPFDVDVPWKFGLYEYGTESFRAYRTETLLVVEVEE